jgi:hypothetical protein
MELLFYFLRVRMSLQSEIVDTLNKLWQKQREQKEPASIIVPIDGRSYSVNDSENPSDIMYMSHPDLPAMSNFDFWNHSAMAHNLWGELAYECVGQEASGSFHLIGEPGLFNIGFRKLSTNVSTPNFAYRVRHNQFTSNDNMYNNYEVVTQARANQPVQLFLSSNDNFRVEIDFGAMPEENGNVYMANSNSLIITRLSRNPYFTSVHQYSD